MKSYKIITLVLMTLMMFSFASALLETGLLKYHNFNESSGTVSIDQTVQLNGTIVGTPTLGLTGKLNSVYNYDGSNDQVNLSTNALLRPANTVSLCTWVNTTSTGAFRVVYAYDYDGSNIAYGMRMDNANKMQYIVTTGGTTTYGTGTNVMAVKTWYYVCMVYNGTHLLGYINGTEEYRLAKAGAISYGSLRANHIGVWDQGGPSYTQYWLGQIDELALWDRALSVSEILELFNGSVGLNYPFTNPPTVTLNHPANQTGLTSSLVTMNASVTSLSALANLTNYVWWLNGSLITTNTTTGITGTSNTSNISLTLSQGNYKWNRNYCLSNGLCAFATYNQTFTVDSTFPTIVLNYPTSTIGYGKVGSTLQINFTATDTNLGSCWYNYGGSNVTVLGCRTGVFNITNITTTSQKNITLYANDTAGNLNTTTFTWDYDAFENSQSYNAITQETLLETFSINVTLRSGVSLSSAYLYYNGTAYGGTITSSGSNRVINVSLVVPNVTAQANVSFYWSLNMDTGIANSSSNNQTINSLALDNCGTNTIRLLNFTIYDEDNRTLIPVSQNITSDLYVKLTGDATGTVYEYLAQRNTTANQILICINNALVTGQNYYLDATVQYTATNYVTENYYIENYTTNTTVIPKNISLYLLTTARSTEYKVTYKNSYLLPVEGALIELTRQYVSLPGFLTVEISKTDKDGSTVQHFVSNTEVYTIYVWKDNVLLATFENVKAFCSDILTGNCVINLNERSTTTNPDSFSSYLGVTTLSSYNASTRVYSVSFTGTSGVNSNVSLNIIKNDPYLNQTICTSSLVSSSGTLTCTIPASYINDTAVAKLYVDGALAYSIPFTINPDTSSEQNSGRFMLAFILILTIPLIGISSGPMTIILFFVGLATASGLALLDSTLTGIGGGLLWLIVIGMILLVKFSKRKELV